jgi:GH18 family chitinase
MNVVSVENNNYVISSFDNTQSVTEKCKYIVDKNLGGVISWTILGNYVVKD